MPENLRSIDPDLLVIPSGDREERLVIPKWLHVGREEEKGRGHRTKLTSAEIEAMFFNDNVETTASKWRILIDHVDDLVGNAFARGDLKRLHTPTLETAPPEEITPSRIIPEIARRGKPVLDPHMLDVEPDTILFTRGINNASQGNYSDIADYFERRIRPKLQRSMAHKFIFLDSGPEATNFIAVEDIMQGIWPRLLKDPELVGKFADHDAFTKWCYRVAINITYDNIRQITAHPTERLERMLEMERGQPIGVSDIPETDLIERVKECILDLKTSEQQEVAVLKLIYLMSEANIALVLGSNPGAIKSCRHRIITNLRKQLTAVASEYVAEAIRSKRESRGHRGKTARQ